MVRWVAIAATAAALLGATACGDDDDDDSAEAAETTGGGAVPTAEELIGVYVSSAVDGHELVDGTAITLTFEADFLAVVAGCNTLNGGFSVVDGALEVGTLASTLMACDEALSAQDTWLAGFLEAGPAVALDGDVLTLTGADATITADRQA
jgi:heat shock protein HslJ